MRGGVEEGRREERDTRLLCCVSTAGNRMEHFRYEASPASEHSTRRGRHLRSISIVLNVISYSHITLSLFVPNCLSQCH